VPHILDESMASIIDSVGRIKAEAFGLVGAAADRRRTREIVIAGCGSFELNRSKLDHGEE
jgi:hypothetical protein